jgi:hypothetical protein
MVSAMQVPELAISTTLKDEVRGDSLATAELSRIVISHAKLAQPAATIDEFVRKFYRSWRIR